MACYFSKDDLAKLNNGRDHIRQQSRELQRTFMVRSYKTPRAREYAHQGFCRRLDELARAIDFVFNVLPPEQEDIPDTDNVVAATMLIQSFVFNVSGCLDNLAWIWVSETDLRGKDRKEPDPRWVGLGESYSYVRKSFTKPFQKHLSSRKQWFRHIAEFRDTTAHRIPLYVPPYLISEGDTPRYNQLSEGCTEALQRGDYDTYDQLRAEQKALGRYLPWMTHSLAEKSPTVVFHNQLLQGFATVDELGRKILVELDRFAQLERKRAALRATVFKVRDLPRMILCKAREMIGARL